MKNKKLVLAYSGGLDTSYCAVHLSKDHGYDVHAVSVNTGGFSTDEIKIMGQKAKQLGATTYTSIDAVDEFYEKVVKHLIFGNVLRNNTYPLSVSAERIIQAVTIAEYAKSIDASFIAHGSTGAGNDQVRFDMIFQIMAPGVEIITPIRDNTLTREEEIQYLKEHGFDFNWEKSKYSVNQGLWGTSVGGAETLQSYGSLPEEAYPSQLENQIPTEVQLTFKKGELTAVGETTGSPVELIEYLNDIASKYAIGRDIHVGDTIIGIKGRVGFEAAAPIVIMKAHHLLEKHVLSKWQQYQKDQLSNFYGMLLHEGNYLDPVMRDIEAFLTSTQEKVSGQVGIKLLPYRFELQGIKSPHDLMNAKFGSYGELNKAWTSDDAKGFIKILSNPSKIYHLVNQES